MKTKVSAEQIDALLPQTQCGLCNYKGCLPYAEALAKQAASIDLCPPGGVKGLIALGALLEIDPSPYITEMENKAKPSLLAVIREAECIGCTKCIQACPVDAILGGAKQMHSVISNECTGCELCIAPCPVDCIDMIIAPDNLIAFKKEQFRERYYARQKRLEETEPKVNHSNKKSYLEAALLRAKQKKF